MIKKFIKTLNRLRRGFDSELIEDSDVINCENVYFDRGIVYKRPGYEQLGDNLPLNGRVSLLTEFYKLREDDRQVIACTSRDAYRLYSGSWIFLTPSYSTGTVNVCGENVCGESMTWDTGWPTSQYYIKFGTDDVNGEGSPDAWNLINSFDSTVELTLDSSAETQSGISYVIRKSFSLDASVDWDVCYPIEPQGDDDEVWGLFTNGSELLYYTGTGQLQDVCGETLYSKYVKSYYDHVMLGWVQDSTNELPQSVYWSERGDPIDFSSGSAGYEDLIQGEGGITGWELLNERLYVFKEKTLSEGYFTGQTSPAFTFQQDRVVGKGCPNGKTIVNTGSELLYLGIDNVFSFNGYQANTIGDDVAIDLIENINEEYAYKNFACHIPDKFWYCLFIVTVSNEEPDLVYVFDYRARVWTIWSFADFLRCHGEYINTQGQAWEDVADGISWLDMEGTWGARTLTATSNVHAFGDASGYVYKMDFTIADDDGEDIDCFVTTKDYDNGNDTAMKLIKTILSLNSESGDIQIRFSTDRGQTWSTPVAFTQSVAAREYVQNWIAYGNQVRFRIENIDNSDFEFINMMIGYVDSGQM